MQIYREICREKLSGYPSGKRGSLIPLSKLREICILLVNHQVFEHQINEANMSMYAHRPIFYII